MLAVTNESVNFWAYVGVGYGACAAVLIGYAARTIARGRRLGRQLPPGERRWM